MKLKTLVAAISCAALVLSVGVSANGVSNVSNLSYVSLAERLSIDAEPIVEPDYISFDAYLAKYGTANVVKGFNEAEAKNMRDVLSVNNAQKASIIADSYSLEASTAPNALFEDLSEGTFLGMEVLGVTDIAPGEPGFMVRVKNDAPPPTPQITLPAPTAMSGIASSNIAAATVNTRTESNYRLYYTNDYYGSSDFDYEGEEMAGSYMYKFGIYYAQDYMTTADFVFNNTELFCGSQSNNMYLYVHASSPTQHIDFGLMANPDTSNRWSGLYAFKGGVGDEGQFFDVEPNPKVSVQMRGDGYMLLQNTTVSIGLSVGNGIVEMSMSIGGNNIFYLTKPMSGMISGPNVSLTFLHAMSCVNWNSAVATDINSGSYFKNVRINNPKLISYTLGERYFVPSEDTATSFVVLYKYQKMTYSYTGTSETITIDYN